MSARPRSLAGQRSGRQVEEKIKRIAYSDWFDVSMPLLYGEGDKAFHRLQRKILKTSNDEAIFLWDLSGPSLSYHAILADSASSFGHYSGVRLDSERYISRIYGLARPPYLMTNQGLQFHIPKDLAQKREILSPLNCQYNFTGGEMESAYAIRFERMSDEGRWGKDIDG